jgi:prepilin-type N-terminal cleavage/methylation domain-containing protein
MNQLNKRSGFTLVELIIAVTATAILVLTAGIMLQTTSRAIKRQSDMANLQRDMRVAVPVICRLARVANRTDVYPTGTVFTVTNSSPNYLSIYRANASLVPSSSGNNLVYERGGTKMVLSAGGVKTFFVSRATNSISFTLELTNASDSMLIASNSVFFRN